MLDGNSGIIFEQLECSSNLRTIISSENSLKWQEVCLEIVRAIHALHVKGIFHDLYSGNILEKYYYAKIFDIGKSTMIDDLIAYFIKPGTDKDKQHGNYHSHLAYELRNVPTLKVTVKTHTYSMRYIFSKISRQIKSNPLKTLLFNMMSNNAGEIQNLFM